MTPRQMLDEIRGLLLNMSETTWAEDKERIVLAMLRFRQACQTALLRRAEHEMEEWISVMRICESPKDVAIAMIPEAVRGMYRMVPA